MGGGNFCQSFLLAVLAGFPSCTGHSTNFEPAKEVALPIRAAEHDHIRHVLEPIDVAEVLLEGTPIFTQRAQVWLV